ncbi:MAG TPA: hypothetical protein VD930_13500, partial [Gemmatimonadales bacterium]|nr:hypothetical protein [Gemmatimonadales bacterium]
MTRPTRLSSLALAASLVAPASLLSQDHEHHHGLGELGKVSFPVSCSPAAQQRFEHAMAVLHSF